MPKVYDGSSEIDATFKVDRLADDRFAIFVESRSGGKSSRSARNTQYEPGLDLLLTRLAGIGAVVESVALAPSSGDQVIELQIPDRPFPWRMRTVGSAHDLRMEIGRAQAATNRRPRAKGLGNHTKRIRISMCVPGISGTKEIEQSLAFGMNTDDRISPAETFTTRPHPPTVPEINNSTEGDAAMATLPRGDGFRSAKTGRRQLKGQARVTLHEKFAASFSDCAGERLTRHDIKPIMWAHFPETPEGSILPNDHGRGNVNPCWCAGTDARIFDTVDDPASGRSYIVRRFAPRARIGEPYRIADETTSRDAIDPFAFDPSVVERGVRGHAVTQNALANFLESRGIAPESPRGCDPTFDLAWVRGDRAYVAEVKSLTLVNEERQLRLGLGQVLWYAHELSARFENVHPVLVLERRPSNEGWISLCGKLMVTLIWPNCFGDLFSASQISDDFA